jgi:3-oxoacyl-[acyl-carrier-protein] synthase-3
MGCFSISNVRIAGVSGAVPSRVEDNKTLSVFTPAEADKFISSTGVVSRHVSKILLSSDLCTAAADRLLNELGWDRESVDGLVVVTQSPDYFRPSNATLIQRRLGLSRECAAYCITFGCSGWIYGLQSAAGLIAMGGKRVLLCCGEGIQAYNPLDKSTYPLFGSAGTCTALEFDQAASQMEFHLGTDGEGWKAIYMPDGGYRNPCSERSRELIECEGGSRRTRMNTAMNGMDVFTFAISQPPKSIKTLCGKYSIAVSDIDYLLLHQANLFLNAKIAKKVGVPLEKCPHNIEEYGNSSSGTIPLLMTTRIQDTLTTKPCDMIACAFGVGLSWGSVHFRTDKIVVPELVLLEDSYADVQSFE